MKCQCPACGRSYDMNKEHLGKKAKCRCGEVFDVVSISSTLPLYNLQDDDQTTGGSPVFPHTEPKSHYSHVPPPLSSRTKSHRHTEFKDYFDLPWYRRSGPLSLLTVLGIFFGVSLVPVCIAVATGPVWFRRLREDGEPRAWHPLNKAVAFLLLIGYTVTIWHALPHLRPTKKRETAKVATEVVRHEATAERACSVGWDKIRLQQRVDDGLAWFESGINIDPNYAPGWYGKGWVLIQEKKRPHDALVCFNHVVELDPSHADAWRLRGQALLVTGQPQAALDSVDKALKLYRISPPTQETTGIAVSIDDNGKKELLPDHPSFPIGNALLTKGKALAALGRLPDSLEVLNKASEAYAGIRTGHNFMGARGYQGDASYSEEHSECLLAKGEVLGQLGRHAEAASCFEHALMINPTIVRQWDIYGIGRFNDVVVYLETATRPPGTYVANPNGLAVQSILLTRNNAILGEQGYYHLKPTEIKKITRRKTGELLYPKAEIAPSQFWKCVDLAAKLGARNDVRSSAMDELVKAGKASVDVVSGYLASEDHSIRASAAEVLSRIGTSVCLSRIEPMLKDKEAHVRMRVVRGLSRFGSAKALSLLVDALADEDVMVYWAAVEGLVSCNPELVIPVVEGARKSPTAYIRAGSIRTLACAAGRDAIASIAAGLQDPSPTVRIAAAESLLLLDAVDAGPYLASAKDDPDPVAREICMSAYRILAADASKRPDLIVSFALTTHSLTTTWQDVALEDVIEVVRGVCRTSIYIDWKNLAKHGITQKTGVTMNAQAGSAWDVVNELPDAIGKSDLKVRIFDGVLVLSCEEGLKALAAVELLSDMNINTSSYPTKIVKGMQLVLPKVDLRECMADVALRAIGRVAKETNILVDWHALTEVGVAPDTLVSLQLNRMPVQKVLRFLLHDLGATKPLGCGIQNGMLVISTAEAVTKPRKFDFSASDEPGAVAIMSGLEDKVLDLTLGTLELDAAVSYLRDKLQINLHVNWPALHRVGVKPSTFLTDVYLKNVSGVAALSALVVSAGSQVAYGVRNGIVVISLASDLQSHWPTEVLPNGVSELEPQANLDMRKKLTSELRGACFTATPLSEVLEYLSDVSGTLILVDWSSLAVVGIGKESPVSFAFDQNISIEQILQIVLADFNHKDSLAYWLDSGWLLGDQASVLISTRSKLSSSPTVDKLFGAPGPGQHPALDEIAKIRSVKALLQEGASIDQRDSMKRTQLHVAAQNGDGLLIRYLIAKNASLMAQDFRGSIPLQEAVRSGHISVAGPLINAGTLMHKDKSGKTALHYAASMLSSKEVRATVVIGLLTKDTIAVVDADGQTPLYMAACTGNWLMVKMLVEAGSDLKVTDKNGDTPLQAFMKAVPMLQNKKVPQDNLEQIRLLLGGQPKPAPALPPLPSPPVVKPSNSWPLRKSP